ncbi:Uncharacterized protein M6B38_211595 [Iris pallida]|uniref:Uncharacterized protein n=1 Tax=Iris pallida TaxID=29817 RepID=A0AAX6E2W4_IRIPA|nr:Uncharacterized protein M6B38_211595 [Iris pallida]
MTKTTAAATDLPSQALKCLSDRSPYDSDELLARAVTTLPAGVAVHLAKHSDGRRKYKKSSTASHGDPISPKPSAPSSIWPAMEVFFRPLTVGDVEGLFPKLSHNDPAFLIPKIRSDAEGKVEVEEEKEEEKEEEEKGEVLEIESGEVEEKEEEVQEKVEKIEEEEDDGLSTNWLLGSKHRVSLTTQRPTKKRKLLGGNAGLDQLLILPHSPESSSLPQCDICCLGESTSKSNRLVSCSSCSVTVHRKCYGSHGITEDSQLCAWCNKEGEDTGPESKPCLLCPRPGGALKPISRKSGSGEKKFAHLFCALWAPEVYVEDTREMEPIMNVEGVLDTRWKLVCNVCKVKQGVCVRCSFGTCRTAFHPICAREARHRMEIWGKLGCDNVELRAFCAKHTTFQDSDSAQHREHLTRSVHDELSDSVSMPLPAPLLVNKLPKLRLSCKNKDKSTAQSEIKGSNLKEVVKNTATFEQDSLALSRTPEGGDVQLDRNLAIGVVGDEESLSNVSNLILFFKKLIGRGKIVIGDVASEMGIPSDSLEAALTDEASPFSSELRAKITKWLQSSIHMPTSTRHLKFRNGSGISSGHIYSIGHGKFDDPDNIDDIRVKSIPPRRRTKSNIRILKEDKTISSSGEELQESANDELGNEISNVSVGHVDHLKDAFGNMIHHQDRSCEHEVKLEKIPEETSPDSNPCENIPTEPKDNSSKIVSPCLPEAHQPHHMEEHIPVNHGSGQADEAYINSDDTINKEKQVEKDCNMDVVVSATPDLKVGESSSGSYVHPYIQKRLIQAQKDAHFQQKSREADSNGHTENLMSDSTRGSCDRPSLYSTVSDVNHMVDVASLDQLAKARDSGILELSPEDEVEGEMLYLQNRLLDNAVAIKHSCEDLIGKVVQKLPQELAALKKRQWDLVVVNQYLREVREAKKWGRKERKHREAQAVLAAAAAAAAASSRNPLLRKDANDEGLQSPMNISVASGRVPGHSPLGPRLKEMPRSGFVKVSPDKDSTTFHMPELSKESELSCDICRRPETLLNRIFVCSSCKVAVHLDCYRKLKDPVGPWKCELCEETSRSGSPRCQTLDNRERPYVAECLLCGGYTGAFRKSTNGHWVHAFCAEWLLESTFRRGQQNHVDGVDALSKEKDLFTCGICHQKFGVCSKCSYGNCQVTFHPLCARTAGLYMNVKAVGGRLHHKAYCEKHSLEQRQKADNQQYGTEELKNIKQIRVELEKVRLLCERIIKREKLKRDLVLCSHDILASRRDYVAFSVLERSSFPPGVSSESATTSIDNKSYSGIVQRSEDITVDSTVSGKHNVRISIDVDRKTDDSSTSRPSFKRKISDRASFSGKQLPHRATSVPVQNSPDYLEKRFKPRKQPECFHKEVVMTSHQASMQNQRLPKGFAYVPVGSLSKEKPVVHDPESHEPREPGG